MLVCAYNVLDMTLNNLMVRLGDFGNVEYLFIVIAPRSTLAQIQQTVRKQMPDVKWRLLYSNTWNYLTVCKKKMSSGLFNNVSYEIFLQIIYV